MLSIQVYNTTMPFVDEADNHLAIVAQWQLFLMVRAIIPNVTVCTV